MLKGEDQNNRNIKLSIIIPTLNEESTIQQLIEFLWKNAPENEVEIIVADGQSSDRTVELAGYSGAIVRVCNQKSRAHQMNEGAKLAQGQTLWFVHADTIPPTSFIKDIQEAIEKGASLGSYRFQFDSNRIMLRINSWFTRFNLLTFRGGDQTLFITSSAFETLNGFDEDFSIMEEYDLLQRARNKFDFCLIPKSVLVSARKYDQNSYMKVNLANLRAFRMFKRGEDPQKIKDFYFNAIEHPKE
jgi:rSAM/selenodomain-associated transferase 2